jgi:N-glycosidase YbiA
MAKPVNFFSKTDTFAELSNFAPYGFEETGIRWPTVEHYFQAQKFHDPAYRERIRLAGSPRHAKTLGQSRSVPIRADWAEWKESIMLHALRLKFLNPKLRSLLLDTKNRELIENSPYHSYWDVEVTARAKTGSVIC